MSAKATRTNDLIRLLWVKRWRMLSIATGVSVLVLLVNLLLLPNYYKSTAVLLPEMDRGRGLSMSALSGLAELAGSLGAAPASSIAKLYPQLVTSEVILEKVLLKEYPSTRYSTPVNLIRYFELNELPPAEAMDKALKKIRSLMTTNNDPRTGLFTVTLEMEEPALAADVLNTIVAELDLFMRDKKKSGATEQTVWISGRLNEVKQDLKAQEDRLKSFRERNRRIMDSPDLLTEEARIQRSVQVASTVFFELTKQYELSKIEEFKNLTIVNVLDDARPAVWKERPHRLTNTVGSFLLSVVLLSLWYAYGSSYKARLKRQIAAVSGPGPDEMKHWHHHPEVAAGDVPTPSEYGDGLQ